MRKICELCGSPSEMDFNAVVPISAEKAVLVRGSICLECWGKYPSDTAIAVALLTKRKEKTGDQPNQRSHLTWLSHAKTKVVRALKRLVGKSEATQSPGR